MSIRKIWEGWQGALTYKYINSDNGIIMFRDNLIYIGGPLSNRKYWRGWRRG